MSLMEELKDLGVDIDGGLKRFMNNSSLYERMLKKLVSTVNGLEVMPSLKAGDIDKAIENAHTLKGVMGNLSVTPLYEAYTKIVDLLRKNNSEEAEEILEKALPIQKDILDCIDKN